MIKLLTLSRLQNAEYQAFIMDTLKLLEGIQLETLTPIIDKITPLSAKLNTALMQVRKSEHTKHIKELDKLRDRYVYGFFLRVRSDNLSPDDNVRHHAYRLQVLISRYKKVNQENLRVATTLIENLLADLKSEEYKPSVDVLAMSSWVDAIQKSNDDFIKAYDARRNEVADSVSIDVRQVRKVLNNEYKNLTKAIEALHIVTPSAEITQVIARLNANIDKWKDVIALRQGSGKKETKEMLPVMPEPTVAKRGKIKSEPNPPKK